MNSRMLHYLAERAIRAVDEKSGAVRADLEDRCGATLLTILDDLSADAELSGFDNLRHKLDCAYSRHNQAMNHGGAS